ncbi:hypothetical protein AVEN_47757-1 [Araneus ventricosus]|uniref:Uncharacterized protein n=1 Tax=Araneus ventricosus TaxID=182803 RepID=A0A4Y2J6D1_ARAVE|nr:hypothetical protein AVEN_47757-1 [Araneus ventricosus]
MLLNCGDHTRTGAFTMAWPMTECVTPDSIPNVTIRPVLKGTDPLSPSTASRRPNVPFSEREQPTITITNEKAPKIKRSDGNV